MIFNKFGKYTYNKTKTMDNIKVKKEELLEVLKTNKEKHILEFKEALRGYRIKSAELLSDQLAKVENGEDFTMNFNLPKPVSHESEYELAISMLTMDVDKTVELDQHEFSCYVKDNWQWKSSFSHINSGYSGTSGSTGTAGYSGGTGTSYVTFSEQESYET